MSHSKRPLLLSARVLKARLTAKFEIHLRWVACSEAIVRSDERSPYPVT
jgi:hypothetical protein